MHHVLRSPTATVLAALGAASLFAACNVTTDAASADDEVTSSRDAGSPAEDAGARGETDAAPDALSDAGRDAEPDEDAGADAAPLTGCAALGAAAFCDDFDNPDALTAGKTKWDFIEPTDQPVATLSTARSVSPPNALLSQVIDAATPGAKFAKTVTKANFTEVTWEYDVFLENIGTTDGFFLDDFQFTDAVGPDTFGFRLVVFADGGALKQIGVEHNADANGGPYVIEPPLPAAAVTLGAWHHFRQTVKFAFGADAGANAVTYTLVVDDAALPTFEKTYDGITRADAAFARISGMPLVFNKGNSAGLKIYWDNHRVVLR